MVDEITTNKTDFFRESRQFNYLAQKVLPELTEKYSSRFKKNIAVWSAGCSTGEEPFTLAMVLAEFFQHKTANNFSILATDISTRVLATARQGIYSEKEVGPVPAGLKQKYLMRRKDSHNRLYRIVPELRNRIIFERLNLNNEKRFGIRTAMDIIFCRNVINYFDLQTQTRLFEKFYSQLIPGGYMFISHSETLHGINEQFQQVGPSIYRKPE